VYLIPELLLVVVFKVWTMMSLNPSPSTSAIAGADTTLPLTGTFHLTLPFLSRTVMFVSSKDILTFLEEVDSI